MAEKRKGDLFNQDSKKGKSNSQVDFIKGELFDKELEERINSVELSEEDFNSIDFDDIDDIEISDDIEIENDYDSSYLVSEDKKPSVEVLNRKTLSTKIEDKKVSKAVSKEATKMVKDFIKEDLPIHEVRSILEVTQQDKDLLMSFPLGDKSMSFNDKKELVKKLEEINSTDEVNIANASFVLNWLKKRS